MNVSLEPVTPLTRSVHVNGRCVGALHREDSDAHEWQAGGYLAAWLEEWNKSTDWQATSHTSQRWMRIIAELAG